MRVALCAAAGVLVVLTSGSASGKAPARVAYVTVVGGTSEQSLGENTYLGFVAAVRHLRVKARVVFVPPQGTWAGELALVAREGYGLIVAAPGPEIDLGAVRDAALRFPRLSFLTEDVDPSLVPQIPRNMAIYTLRTEEAAFLAGDLAALVEDRHAGRHVVSSVGGLPNRQVRDVIAGFEAGARHADPHIIVLHGYSNDFLSPTLCRPIALEQIAKGSGAVLDTAGPCGVGALLAARDHGVWGIGINTDMSTLGSFILTSVLRREEPLFTLMLRAYLHRSLPLGSATSVGLRDGVVGLGRISRRVPKSIVAKVARLEAQIVAGAVAVPSAK